MRELLTRSKIELAPPALDKLWRFHQLLRERNEDRDLTRLIEFESVVIKHYVDSLYVGKLVKLPSPLVDVGTGAGFPGIPLKIGYPDIELILAEQRPRRVMFLNDAIRLLGLRNVKTFDHRVVSRSFTEPVRGVITRAVEPITKTLLRTSGATDIGSQIIFMKGPGVDEELREAVRDFKRDYKLIRDQPYSLPHTTHDRRLVIFERLTPRSVVAESAEEETGNDDTEDQA
ncbi:MAG TPA: 16S rRNA (guanine(527)-N(7))-methyltransferase RsmG [Polyangiales bacterium]|nr:16S rRNA (guanine(527)-N(7))-methyltransferase RsmG [Polyangiales bacterium]